MEWQLEQHKRLGARSDLCRPQLGGLAGHCGLRATAALAGSHPTATSTQLTCSERAARSWADSRLQEAVRPGRGGGWRAAGTRQRQQGRPAALPLASGAQIGLKQHCRAPEAGVQHRLRQLGESGGAVQLGALHGCRALLLPDL